MEVKQEKENIFSTEELANISNFTSVLQKIRKRLLAEGQSIDELREKLINQDVI